MVESWVVRLSSRWSGSRGVRVFHHWQSTICGRKAKPWFVEDCQAAKKERNKANRLANKHPSAANIMRARLIEARTKKLFKQKKRDSWKNYVSSVNVNTPPKKVWDMIRKITGKNIKYLKARCQKTLNILKVLSRTECTVGNSIMMLVRFGDLSQSDCSKWVMWQVKDPQPRPGWDGCLTWEKVAFIKCVKKIK